MNDAMAGECEAIFDSRYGGVASFRAAFVERIESLPRVSYPRYGGVFSELEKREGH